MRTLETCYRALPATCTFTVIGDEPRANCDRLLPWLPAITTASSPLSAARSFPRRRVAQQARLGRGNANGSGAGRRRRNFSLRGYEAACSCIASLSHRAESELSESYKGQVFPLDNLAYEQDGRDCCENMVRYPCA